MKYILLLSFFSGLCVAENRFLPEDISFEISDGFLLYNLLIVKSRGEKIKVQATSVNSRGISCSYLSDLEKLRDDQMEVIRSAQKKGVFVTFNHKDRLTLSRVSIHPEPKSLLSDAEKLLKKLNLAEENSLAMTANVLPEIAYLSESAEVCGETKDAYDSDSRATIEALQKVMEEIVELKEKLTFISNR